MEAAVGILSACLLRSSVVQERLRSRDSPHSWCRRGWGEGIHFIPGAGEAGEQGFTHPLLHFSRTLLPRPSLDFVLPASTSRMPRWPLPSRNDFSHARTKPWCDVAWSRRLAEQSQVFLRGSADGQPGTQGPFCPCPLQISACAKDTHFYSCIRPTHFSGIMPSKPEQHLEITITHLFLNSVLLHNYIISGCAVLVLL